MSDSKPGAAAFCLALLIAMPLQAGETLDRVRRTGVLNDVLFESYPPFSFMNSQNELSGFDVDVARAVAARLGVKLRLNTPGWETISAGHWRGRWDVCICSMSPTPERALVLSFPARYYSSPAVLVVNKNETRIHSIADISGRRIGVGMGSSYERYVNRSLSIPGSRPLEYPFHDVVAIPGDETVNFRNLALGPGVRLDAIVSDLATARSFIEATHALRIVGDPLYAEPNMVATDKGDDEWDALMARTVAELRSDGTLARISRQWLGTDVTGNEP